ncbi:Zn-dependent exopeptidase [Suillus subalutaceus]|uniref:Zn-dependent exopeptidase n=1 Tax=Suillus subalutaceus TaxID=48586 RepID=UPI001B87B8F7|nr:Zn-dependent exopeptidase [Suillus subalutaceus]KAG1831453.1 Zn-dependent exopeptidase [Suillus subalutaceus]
MRTLTALYAFLPVLFASAAVFDQPPPQDVLRRPTVDTLADRDAIIESLLATHAGDPVQVMRLLDPENASELDAPRLLQVFGAEAVWMTEGDKLRLRQQGLGFIDLTDHQDLYACHVSAESIWPKLQYQEKVTSVTKLLSKDEMKKQLEELDFVPTTGIIARSLVSRVQRWLYNQILDIISTAPPGVRLSVETFTHTFPQPSVIARFEPFFGRSSPNPTIALPRIITMTAQERSQSSRRSELLSNLDSAPERPVEFHWYAGEEGGLLGSQEVVSEYTQLKKEVGAMIQFDMTAYVPKGEVPIVTFITTDVDSNLTNWATALAEEYSTSVVGVLVQAQTTCHGIERDSLPYLRQRAIRSGRSTHTIHTSEDKIDLADGEFSFEHALEFAKVAVGFVVELGGWVQ